MKPRNTAPVIEPAIILLVVERLLIVFIVLSTTLVGKLKVESVLVVVWVFITGVVTIYYILERQDKTCIKYITLLEFFYSNLEF